MAFKQLKGLRWPDLITFTGLLAVTVSMFCSYRHRFLAAYALLFVQLVCDFFDGRLARKIGGGILGLYLDSFSDFVSVCASVVFGWFLGVTGLPMLIAGFLNIAAAAIRLSYFTVRKKGGATDFTGLPTVAAAVGAATLALLGYFLLPHLIKWFVILYFAAAVAMVSDLRIKKPAL